MSPPAHELAGSVAAARVAAHARASELFFAHFEHHLHLDDPEAWDPGRPDLAGATGWRAGVLREAKFRHFRLDRMVASFHPAHGPRWSAHELCHRLVGWAWRPDASPLWLATAARLAELVPVALWYFYDAGAPRCARHALSDPRFDVRCPACEALAEASGSSDAASSDAAPTSDAELERLREEGDRFVARELEAVHRTLRSGTPVPHRWATLELATDGLAWAASHGPRLASPQFHAWVERFVPDGAGRHGSLEALEARALEVLAALRDGAPLTPWRADRRRWVAQDLGWRMATIQADCDPDTAARIDAILDRLADDLDPARAAAAWAALADDVEVPAVEDLFAVGYDLGVAGPDGRALGRSVSQVAAGLATVCPGALSLLGDDAADVVADFVAADPWVRRPLGRRFAGWLADHVGGEAADLAGLEAAVVHAPPMDPAVATLRDGPDPGGPVRRAPGVTFVRAKRDWRDWIGRKARRRPAVPPEREVWLSVVREPDGEVSLWEVDAAVAAVGDTPVEPRLDASKRLVLLAAGIWAPARWDV